MKNIAYVMLLSVFVVTIGLNTSTYAQGDRRMSTAERRDLEEERRNEQAERQMSTAERRDLQQERQERTERIHREIEQLHEQRERQRERQMSTAERRDLEEERRSEQAERQMSTAERRDLQQERQERTAQIRRDLQQRYEQREQQRRQRDQTRTERLPEWIRRDIEEENREQQRQSESYNYRISGYGQDLSLQNGDRIAIPYSPYWQGDKRISVTIEEFRGRMVYVTRITNPDRSALEVIREEGWQEAVKLGLAVIQERGVAVLFDARTGSALGRLVGSASGVALEYFYDVQRLGDPEIIYYRSANGVPVRYEISVNR